MKFPLSFVAALALGGSTASAQFTIMPLGDSITFGLSFGQPANQMYPNGYRGRLQDLLQQRSEFADNFDFIGLQSDGPAGSSFDSSLPTTDPSRYDGNHNGYSSYTTAQSHGTSPGNLNDVLNGNYTPATFDADIVLLHVGINDLIAQGVSAAQLQADYRTLLTTIFSLNTEVDLYVSTIMLNQPFNGNYQNILDFNAYLATTEVPYWQAQGNQITLVDMFAALEDTGYGIGNPNYGTVVAPNDNVHPNANGYQAMAEAWNLAIVPEPTTTSLFAGGLLLLALRRRS